MKIGDTKCRDDRLQNNEKKKKNNVFGFWLKKKFDKP